MQESTFAVLNQIGAFPHHTDEKVTTRYHSLFITASVGSHKGKIEVEKVFCGSWSLRNLSFIFRASRVPRRVSWSKSVAVHVKSHVKALFLAHQAWALESLPKLEWKLYCLVSSIPRSAVRTFAPRTANSPGCCKSSPLSSRLHNLPAPGPAISAFILQAYLLLSWTLHQSSIILLQDPGGN